MASADSGWSTLDLREMDREEARRTLPVAEFERWEALQARVDAADDTRERWADEDAEVEAIVVNADPEELGTRVDLFGNDVLVRVNPENDEFREAAEAIEAEFGDVGTDAALDLDAEARERLCDGLQDMLDAVILEWDGTDWQALREPERGAVLADARDKWGVDGLLLAWVDIAAAINEERESTLGVIESFRGETRRGHR